MKILLACCALGVLAFVGCDRTSGVRTTQSAGGPGNAPNAERSPTAAPTPVPSTTP